MSKGTQTFRKADVTRALKAGLAAGVDVVRVEITRDGKITMIVRPPNSTTPDDSGRGNEWDNVQ